MPLSNLAFPHIFENSFICAMQKVISRVWHSPHSLPDSRTASEHKTHMFLSNDLQKKYSANKVCRQYRCEKVISLPLSFCFFSPSHSLFTLFLFLLQYLFLFSLGQKLQEEVCAIKRENRWTEKKKSNVERRAEWDRRKRETERHG